MRVRSRSKGKRTNVQSGGRNLVILGIASTLVAISTTGVSLAIYHNSGDIYLDRSRPGYLPDEEEIKEENDDEEEDYDFEKNGSLTEAGLTVFLENLDEEIKAIGEYEKPFDEGALSDKQLGITADGAMDTDENSANGGTGEGIVDKNEGGA